MSEEDLKKLNILVIDDDEFMLDIVSMTLERLGYNLVTVCSDGRKALQKIDDGERFDVAMVDLNMPLMDGIEVLRYMAARQFSGGILLFSGEDARILKTALSLASAHNLNVLGSLHKPVTINALKKVLDKYHSKSDVSKRKLVELVGADELRNAITEGQIVPFYQPKVRVVDKSLASAEVLARWHHPERGLVPPIAFISVAEEHGIINELTRVIFEQAIEQFGKWRKQGHEFTLGMNLSADSLSVIDLPEQISALASANDVPCSAIELEITESRLMQNLATSLDVLTRFRLKGFGLSIDDFGTGFSSMSQLSNVPFTELKIDRAFVHGVENDASALAILESSVQLAKRLELTVVAEGVEDQSDWNQVAAAQCDLVQGYFIAKPMPASEFERWITSHQTHAK